MCKIHVLDTFQAFYIQEKIILANIAKIKSLLIKVVDSMSFYISARVVLLPGVGLDQGPLWIPGSEGAAIAR